MAKKQLGIFYIDQHKAYFYGSNSASVLQVDIPADTMAYFDVVNKDKFYQIIQTLLTTNKIAPLPLLILFSTAASYEKDVEGKMPDEITTNVAQFLDVVPYDRVLSKTYKLQDKTKIVAVNKDLYEVLRRAFEKMNFQIVGVAALSVLQQAMPDIGTSLNLGALASKFDAIKQYSFITVEEMNYTGKVNKQETDTNKPNPFRLYGLVGVFVVLIGILVFMVMQMLKPTSKPVVIKPAVVVSVPTPTLLPVTVTQAASASPSLRPTVSPTPQTNVVTPTTSQ